MNNEVKEMSNLKNAPINLTNNRYNRAKFCFALGREFFDSNAFYGKYYYYGNTNNIANISAETLKNAIQFINRYVSNKSDVLPLCKVNGNGFILINNDKKYLVTDKKLIEIGGK